MPSANLFAAVGSLINIHVLLEHGPPASRYFSIAGTVIELT